MKSLIRLLFLLWIAGFSPLQAHQAFESTVKVSFEHGQTEVTIIFSGATIGAILNEDRVDTTPLTLEQIRAKMLPQASQLFSAISNGKPLVLKRSKLGPGVGNEVEMLLLYPPPMAGPFEVDARYFAKLDSRANGTMVVTAMGEDSEVQLGNELINREKHALKLTLPTRLFAAPPPSAAATVATTGTPTTSASSSTFWEFLKLGILHILTGYDHLLFLCGLLVVCRRPGPVLAIITAFTIAHSITLALAALHLVNISSRIIEPLIAATIIFVGVENLWLGGKTKGRAFVAGSFGFIHGFGFASALSEAGLGSGGPSIAVPLLSFNLGVEIGQLTFASLFLPLVWALRKTAFFERHGVKIFSSVVVALGAYWLTERVFFGAS
ncbi:MAG: HupE/UreJ family protein [Chthoniobacteraceae bacterium]